LHAAPRSPPHSPTSHPPRRAPPRPPADLQRSEPHLRQRQDDLAQGAAESCRRLCLPQHARAGRSHGRDFHWRQRGRRQRLFRPRLCARPAAQQHAPLWRARRGVFHRRAGVQQRVALFLSRGSELFARPNSKRRPRNSARAPSTPSPKPPRGASSTLLRPPRSSSRRTPFGTQRARGRSTPGASPRTRRSPGAASSPTTTARSWRPRGTR